MRYVYCLGLALVLGVVGCGGGTSVASAVKQVSGAQEVNCAKAGWMVFVGQRETVYDCTGSDASGASHSHCYVVVDKEAQDVTDDLIDSTPEWACASERKAARDGLQQAQDTLVVAQHRLVTARAKARYWKAQGAQKGSLAERATTAMVSDATQLLANAEADLTRAKRVVAETGTSP